MPLEIEVWLIKPFSRSNEYENLLFIEQSLTEKSFILMWWISRSWNRFHMAFKHLQYSYFDLANWMDYSDGKLQSFFLGLFALENHFDRGHQFALNSIFSHSAGQKITIGIECLLDYAWWFIDMKKKTRRRENEWMPSDKTLTFA